MLKFQTHNKKADNFMEFALNDLKGSGVDVVMSPSNHIYYKETGKIKNC